MVPCPKDFKNPCPKPSKYGTQGRKHVRYLLDKTTFLNWHQTQKMENVIKIDHLYTLCLLQWMLGIRLPCYDEQLSLFIFSLQKVNKADKQQGMLHCVNTFTTMLGLRQHHLQILFTNLLKWLTTQFFTTLKLIILLFFYHSLHFVVTEHIWSVSFYSDARGLHKRD